MGVSEILTQNFDEVVFTEGKEAPCYHVTLIAPETPHRVNYQIPFYEIAKNASRNYNPPKEYEYLKSFHYSSCFEGQGKNTSESEDVALAVIMVTPWGMVEVKLTADFLTSADPSKRTGLESARHIRGRASDADFIGNLYRAFVYSESSSGKVLDLVTRERDLPREKQLSLLKSQIYESRSGEEGRMKAMVLPFNLLLDELIPDPQITEIKPWEYGAVFTLSSVAVDFASGLSVAEVLTSRADTVCGFDWFEGQNRFGKIHTDNRNQALDLPKSRFATPPSLDEIYLKYELTGERSPACALIRPQKLIDKYYGGPDAEPHYYDGNAQYNMVVTDLQSGPLSVVQFTDGLVCGEKSPRNLKRTCEQISKAGFDNSLITVARNWRLGNGRDVDDCQISKTVYQKM